MDGQLVVWQTKCKNCGLLPGDVLVAIDGVPMKERMLQLMPYTDRPSHSIY